jgi:retron-type reverse transcriptase
MRDGDAGKKAERPERPRGGGDGIAEPRAIERQTRTAYNDKTGDETPKLMEEVLRRENIKAAYERVVHNGGAPGVDGMTVEALMTYCREHWARIRNELLSGKYMPKPVRKVEIPKPDGKGIRMLGIPTVMDRLIEQAILQVLQPIFDPTFSDASFGFRPGRSVHGAIARAREHMAARCRWLVDLDLEKFFDRVNHDVLMARVARRVKDKRVLLLIRRYLQAGMMESGLVSPRSEGVPQGSPLSPLLSNVLLDELDKELERRGHRFVRFADGMPEEALDDRVKVPSPQLPIRGSSSEAACAGDRTGQVPRHRPQKAAAEQQAVAKANPQCSLVILRSGGRPSRRKGKADRSREAMGTSTAMAPSGRQGRHVAKVQWLESGRSGRTIEGVAPVAGVYKADRRNDAGVRPEVGGAGSTRAGEDSITAPMVKLVGDQPVVMRREGFARGRGPAFINALEAASEL